MLIFNALYEITVLYFNAMLCSLRTCHPLLREDQNFLHLSNEWVSFGVVDISYTLYIHEGNWQ